MKFRPSHLTTMTVACQLRSQVAEPRRSQSCSAATNLHKEQRTCPPSIPSLSTHFRAPREPVRAHLQVAEPRRSRSCSAATNLHKEQRTCPPSIPSLSTHFRAPREPARAHRSFEMRLSVPDPELPARSSAYSLILPPQSMKMMTRHWLS